MTDESYSFSTARVRLEEIVAQVRKKDTSLEKSLDLLEEGVRLANACTELIDHADWTAGGVPVGAEAAGSSAEAASPADGAACAEDPEPDSAGLLESDDSAATNPDVDANADTDVTDAYDDFDDADEAWADGDEASA